MQKAIIPALLLVLISVVLAETVFREQVAAAASNLNVFVTNDVAHPVPVHEQGTAAVRSADQEVSVTAASNEQLSTDCGGLLYTVPTGKQLVVNYISAFASVAGATSASGEISADTNQAIGLLLPVVFQNQAFHVFSASEAVHYVIPPGTEIQFGASFEGATDCSVRFALGGILQPSP